jgi:hypothetical protein
MTEKKISRRDAMKMLGVAVGAAALSTLPSKWNTPELVAGVLPAHARQSGGPVCAPIVRTAIVGFLDGDSITHTFTLDSPLSVAEIDLCPRRGIFIEWDGDVPPPAFGEIGLNGAASIMFDIGSTLPLEQLNSGYWTPGPFSELSIRVTGGGTWYVGSVLIIIA